MKDGDWAKRFFVGNEINSGTAMNTGNGLMIWGDGVEIVFDRYSSADTNETIVRANILANVGITFPTAFTAAREDQLGAAFSFIRNRRSLAEFRAYSEGIEWYAAS